MPAGYMPKKDALRHMSREEILSARAHNILTYDQAVGALGVLNQKRNKKVGGVTGKLKKLFGL